MTRYQWLGLLVVAGSAAAAEPPADGWITHADAGTRTPMVLQFRRELLAGSCACEVAGEVTADNRFVLYVNGTRVASGPSTGTIAAWRYSTIDLAPHLRAGERRRRDGVEFR